MQDTRLFSLFSSLNNQLSILFNNPWRRFSLIIISLFVGFFAGSAISTTAGQAAQWDISIGAILLLFTELINKFVYSRQLKKYFWIDVLNIFKIGLVYSLYLEAFKLGS